MLKGAQAWDIRRRDRQKVTIASLFVFSRLCFQKLYLKKSLIDSTGTVLWDICDLSDPLGSLPYNFLMLYFDGFSLLLWRTIKTRLDRSKLINWTNFLC